MNILFKYTALTKKDKKVKKGSNKSKGGGSYEKYLRYRKNDHADNLGGLTVLDLIKSNKYCKIMQTID